jgi:hypothetical protein
MKSFTQLYIARRLESYFRTSRKRSLAICLLSNDEDEYPSPDEESEQDIIETEEEKD